MNSNQVPRSCRFELVNALHADDPEAVAKHLECSSRVERYQASHQKSGASKLPSWAWQLLPSSCDKESRLKEIDTVFCKVVIESELNTASPSLATVAFVIAAEFSLVRVLSLLLSNKFASEVDPSYDSNHAIRMACHKGHLGVMEMLLNDDRVDPATGRNDAIRMASANGLCDMVKLLMNDSRVDPSANKNNAIRWASSRGHTDVVKLLMSDKRVDASAFNNYAIRLAGTEKHFGVIQLLLEDKRVDPNAHGQLAFKRALEFRNVDTLRQLLAHDQVVVTNDLVLLADQCNITLNALFTAAGPRCWPRVIGNDAECLPQELGSLRTKLNGIELETSWMLMLCVKRILTPVDAARVGDVMRDVCEEWTLYGTKECKLADSVPETGINRIVMSSTVF